MVSYRVLEEIFGEHGVLPDHATRNLGVARYSPLVVANERGRKAPTNRAWCMDETHIRVKGDWVYLHRAVDNLGKTLDFLLSNRRNKSAATKFVARAPEVDGLPHKIAIDRSGANTAGINAINRMLTSFGHPMPIELVKNEYLNKMVEQDHRTIKKESDAAASSENEGDFRVASCTDVASAPCRLRQIPHMSNEP